MRRKGWLQRTHHRRAEPSDAAPEAPAPGAGAGAGEPAAPDTPTSLDQVLRNADEARRAERDPDD